MECEALWTVLWNFGHCKQFCGMRDAGDIFLFFYFGCWIQFCGMWGTGDCSVECEVL